MGGQDFEREVEAEIQRPVEEDFIQEFSDPAITSDPVRMFFREIGRTALLTGDEEVYLWDQIHKGKAAEGRLPLSRSWTNDTAMSWLASYTLAGVPNNA